jgi:hypothetical protein
MLRKSTLDLMGVSEIRACKSPHEYTGADTTPSLAFPFGRVTVYYIVVPLSTNFRVKRFRKRTAQSFDGSAFGQPFPTRDKPLKIRAQSHDKMPPGLLYHDNNFGSK